MSLEHLLLWLSAKEQGSWSQFRGGVEQLCSEPESAFSETEDDREPPATAGGGLPLYQHIRLALQRLGHVEFFYSPKDSDWRVVPPTVALFPQRLGEGVLCGARSPDLLQGLVANLDVLPTVADGMPDRIVLRGSFEAMAASAAHLGLEVQVDAPVAILSAIPAARNPSAWSVATIPDTAGWTVHRFSSSRLAWFDSTAKAALNTRTGLFRFLMRHERRHYLRWRGRSYHVPVQVGKYAVMRRRPDLLAYNRSNQTLSLPAVCRPPLLIERALVLCSGLLPSFDRTSGCVQYGNVLPTVAHLTAELLRQEIIN